MKHFAERASGLNLRRTAECDDQLASATQAIRSLNYSLPINFKILRGKISKTFFEMKFLQLSLAQALQATNARP
ncbi:hypothetical protein [uncultured Campylobacter sp.]|uniref:hypothetical protein n=1 Tax=uncultured Campylobacter sp. TaxID=218934 RepID=UPI00260CE047|nr:hypothetical protein [uncultured Campylobacter sp.]